MDFPHLLETNLPPERLALLRSAGEIALEEGMPLYLVGGAVRDLLLGRPLEDLDLVVEGDAETLAYVVAKRLSGEVVARSQFSTAKLKVDGLSLDLVTARRESYPRPGALPQVVPGTMKDDLARRDFSINAMAFPIHKMPGGELLDPHGGMEDLQRGLIRVLHERSFIDDATRILRALRYEQRLGFRLEESTEALLRRDLSMLDTISGDRLRKEIHLWIRERRPCPLLLRAYHLGVLGAIHPSLSRAGPALESAMQLAGDGHLEEQVWIALMAYALSPQEGEHLIQRLRMPSGWATTVRDAIAIRDVLPTVSQPDVPPAQLYDALVRRSPAAVRACALATPREEARWNLSLFLEKLRHVRPALNGRDLIELGIPQGPAVGEMLSRLRRSQLEGAVGSREEEVTLVKQMMASDQPPLLP
ncbi:MAG: CCA tRNA nucleotidyltransferase [Chloroflexi bacterium]|nr:CCA tRNA nucleotidyltransferase [Chloroflexota bacterium]